MNTTKSLVTLVTTVWTTSALSVVHGKTTLSVVHEK
jgi:hypothetical protein